MYTPSCTCMHLQARLHARLHALIRGRMPMRTWATARHSASFAALSSGRSTCSSARRTMSTSTLSYPDPPPNPEADSRFFYDTKISEAAAQHITPVTLEHLLRLGDEQTSKDSLLSSANFLRRELPLRLARRVKAIQKLPFIVGMNPWIRTIYDLYVESFEQISSYPEINTMDDEQRFTELLTSLTDAHSDVVPKLARGFLESEKYISKEEVTDFLDKMINARIGIRVLAEHHLALHDNVPGWTGIVNTRLSPHALVRDVGAYVHEVCEINYGSAPELEFIERGVDAASDVDVSRFAYIPVHLEYMLMEILKNAMRATVEFSSKTKREAHPPLEVTIASSEDSIGIRIRDQGGGIPYSDMHSVFEYSYTTVPKYEEATESIFGTATKMAMQGGVGGPMAGLGFGLPMTRIYARYFGGSFELQTLHGYGCDAFLRIPNIAQLLKGTKTVYIE